MVLAASQTRIIFKVAGKMWERASTVVLKSQGEANGNEKEG